MATLVNALVLPVKAMAGPLVAMWRYRDLLFRLMIRETVSRTSGTVLGGFWLLMQPALQVLAFWFLLDYVLKVRTPGRVVFLDYFLIAMVPWLLINETLNRSLSVLNEFSALYQRTLFPVKILPLVPLLMGALILAPVYAGVAVVFVGVAGFFKAWIIMLLLTVWLLPFCYLNAILGLFYREFRQVFPFLLTMLMYATPILYQPEALPEEVQQLMAFNIMADIVALIEHTMHEYDFSITTGNWLRPVAIWLLLMPPAWILFRRAEPHMREEL